MIALGILVLLGQIVSAVGLCYHYFLLVAGHKGRAVPQPLPDQSLRFAVIVPAHNEAAVIGGTVAALRNVNYPADRFDVVVVADHCTDDTAEVARAAGALVYERNEGARGRKGYALQWGLDRVLEIPGRYGAVVIFDADSRVAPDFLQAMSQALAAGHQAVQGQHVIANPQASIFSRLAEADMLLNNRIRNQAKENLGLSARLMGDAMCFRREILQRYPWVGADSLTEDREFSLHLVIDGVRVHYAPGAISRGQAASRWSDATGQRMRWYGGGFELRRRYLGPLLAAAGRRGNLDALDRLLELVLPPFSVLASLPVALIVVQGACALVVRRVPGAWQASLLLLGAAFLFPWAALLTERAPARTIWALAYGPLYVAWRIGISLMVRLRRGKVPWIRTRRTEEIKPVQ